MADVYVKMASYGDSPEKYLDALRRRIEMRRLAVAEGGKKRRRETFDLPGGGREKRGRAYGRSREAPVIASTSGNGTAAKSLAVFGSVSLTGRAREMEDAISVRPVVFRPPEGGVLPHLFAVFDGHGGSHVSVLCKDRMHVNLSEELGRTWQSTAAEETVPPVPEDSRKLTAKQVEEASALGGGAKFRADGQGSADGMRVRDPAVPAVRVRAVRDRVGYRWLNGGGRSRWRRPRCRRQLRRLPGGVQPRRPGRAALLRSQGDKYLKPVVISKPEIYIMERSREDVCLIMDYGMSCLTIWHVI